MTQLLLFLIMILAPISVRATDLNYLPDDVYIVQQEEKSELEYRLRQLEAGLNGNLSIYLNNIEYRIAELERKMQTEINYIKGTYGSYGIVNQIPSAVAKIEAEFESEISSLEYERDQLKRTIREQEDAEDEIAKLEARIAELESQYVAPSQPQVSLPSESVERPTASAMFEYIDSLSLHEASLTLKDLQLWDPDMYTEVRYLIDLKYPHGKPGSAMYDEYLAQKAEEIVSTIPDVTPDPQTYTPKPVTHTNEPEAIAETATNTVSETEEILEDVIVVQQEPEPAVETPEPKNPSIFVRILNFFRSWF